MTTPQDPNQSPGWGQQQPNPGGQVPQGQQPQGQQPPQDQPWGAPQQPGQQQPGEQQPGQSQPGQSYGQQPGQGQPWQGQPGQQGQPWQQDQPGQQPWGAQPGSPAAGGQPWSGQQSFGQLDKKKSGARKWLPAAGIAAALFVGLSLVGGLGGAPEVGDCTDDSPTAIEVVDCDSDEAAFRVAGVVEDVTENELAGDQTLCTNQWPQSVAYAVTESDADEEGTGFCLEEL